MQGFPTEVLLIFTLLIWVLYGLIFLSSPKNKVNQWCCICGFLLSIGVLKEYIYYSGMLSGMEVTLFGINYELNDLINSILTAVLYYISMPCVMILSFYFCHLDQYRPKLFRFLCVIVFILVFTFCIVYPWSQTRVIPIENPSAYLIVASYNLIYGLLATIPILVTLYTERNTIYYRQRRLVSVIGLLPLWYWLITVFLFHLLKLERLYKLWQGNAIILIVLFVYYVYHLFRDGIWGMRINREYFDWTGEQPKLPDNTRYVVHMLKNELAKLSWCSQSIRSLNITDAAQELDIIDHSISHIEEFVRRSSAYSGELTLKPVPVNVHALFEAVAGEMTGEWTGNVVISTDPKCPDLVCDYEHMKEVLCDLTANALTAMGDTGTLTFSCQTPARNITLLRVSDTGCGIPEDKLLRIFDPYYSGAGDSQHMGLGLSYCQKVIRAHRGYIQVKSQTDSDRHGTVFTLCLPRTVRERRRHDRTVN